MSSLIRDGFLDTPLDMICDVSPVNEGRFYLHYMLISKDLT